MSEKFKAIIIDNQNDKFSRDIKEIDTTHLKDCLLYTSPSPRDRTRSRMPSSA